MSLQAEGRPPQAEGRPIDPLSDVLRAVRLDGAYFYTVEASEPWSVEAVAAKDLTPRILPGAEHFFHGRLTELRSILAAWLASRAA